MIMFYCRESNGLCAAKGHVLICVRATHCPIDENEAKRILKEMQDDKEFSSILR